MVALTKGMGTARVQMPDPTDCFRGTPAEKRWAQDIVRMSQMHFDARTPDNVGRRQLILLDETGTAWGLTVDTAGVISTTKLRG